MGIVRNFVGRMYHRSSLFRNLYYLPLDFLDFFEKILGRRDPLIPPRRINVTGRGNFREIGEEFLGHFIKYGGLHPDHTVLDVGSGIGRMAVALTGYLSERGRYHGFDIVPELVAWAKKNITPRYPNFHFVHFDVYNKLYNPQSRNRAAELKFPYENAQFDFVFLTSVFTHMLPRDLEHYLSEISRVLKPGGRCLSTYFLINSEAQGHIHAGKSTQDFKDTGAGYFVIDEQIPEANVGYEEAEIRKMYEKYSLKIIEPVRYGLWCGRPQFLSYQDIIVAEKLTAVNSSSDAGRR